MRRFSAAAALLPVLLMATPTMAAIDVATPQLLPIPGVTTPGPAVSSAPAPLAPPVNPGYAPAPAEGISPILTAPAGPVAAPPVQSLLPPYREPQLPGPIDQQKLTAYRNDLRAQQWMFQSQGQGLGSTARGREILQQLNAPDMQ